jgi:hypothetical protein
MAKKQYAPSENVRLCTTVLHNLSWCGTLLCLLSTCVTPFVLWGVLLSAAVLLSCASLV